MRIGVDIDDCLTNYMEVFLQRVRKYYGVHVPLANLNGFSAKTEDYGYITTEQAKELLSLDQKELVLLNLKPFKQAIEVINLLCLEHKVFLITSRNNYNKNLLRKHTLEWLKKNGINFHKLIFTQDKGVALKKLNLDLMIDDSLKFAMQVASQEGKVILFAQPWNKKYKEFLGKDLSKFIISRCSNWNSVRNIICKSNIREDSNYKRLAI